VRSNRISPSSRSGDLDVAELGLLNIAVHSTTAPLLRLRNRRINAMRTLVDNRARGGGECLAAAFPVTHHVRDRSTWRIRRCLTAARFRSISAAAWLTPPPSRLRTFVCYAGGNVAHARPGASWRCRAPAGLSARTSARGFQIACEKPFEECSTGLIDLNDSVPEHETPIMEVAFIS
jgi:hypothetical protein